MGACEGFGAEAEERASIEGKIYGGDGEMKSSLATMSLGQLQEVNGGAEEVMIGRICIVYVGGRQVWKRIGRIGTERPDLETGRRL